MKLTKGEKTSEEGANSQEIKTKEFYNLKMHKHQVKREEPLMQVKSQGKIQQDFILLLDFSINPKRNFKNSNRSSFCVFQQGVA